MKVIKNILFARIRKRGRFYSGHFVSLLGQKPSHSRTFICLGHFVCTGGLLLHLKQDNSNMRVSKTDTENSPKFTFIHSSRRSLGFKILFYNADWAEGTVHTLRTECWPWKGFVPSILFKRRLRSETVSD